MTRLHTQVLSSVQFSYRLLCRGLTSARSSVQQLHERYISLILLSLRRHCHCWETESPKSLIISTSAYAALTHSFLLCISKGIHSQPRTGLQRDDKAPQPIKERIIIQDTYKTERIIIQDERGKKREEKRLFPPFCWKAQHSAPSSLSLNGSGWSSCFLSQLLEVHITHHSSLWLEDTTSFPCDLTTNINTLQISFWSKKHVEFHLLVSRIINI